MNLNVELLLLLTRSIIRFKKIKTIYININAFLDFIEAKNYYILVLYIYIYIYIYYLLPDILNIFMYYSIKHFRLIFK